MATSKSSKTNSKAGTKKGTVKPRVRKPVGTVKAKSKKVVEELNKIEDTKQDTPPRINWKKVGLMALIISVVMFVLLWIFGPKPTPKPKTDTKYELEMQHLKDTLNVLKATKIIDSITIAKQDSLRRKYTKKDTAWDYLIRMNRIKKAEINKKIYETIPKIVNGLSAHDDSIIRAYTTF